MIGALIGDIVGSRYERVSHKSRDLSFSTEYAGRQTTA